MRQFAANVYHVYRAFKDAFDNGYCAMKIETAINLLLAAAVFVLVWYFLRMQ